MTEVIVSDTMKHSLSYQLKCHGWICASSSENGEVKDEQPC